ncbi:MAG TPA: aminodeoxychorismate synthase component I [Jatrophihabitans sp.]|jgi:para-aminobenzoate synthetase/4-amino-4-deoxychorismate lyase|uniref:aminodeoxychorismate synthase component I n=1 Tax=Jatrophihabitans sp. TaxID=1932789 RepID=UPI002E08AD53|nr:aminodeoxychorismate synthase component I [Jatrophihabitans sp.]
MSAAVAGLAVRAVRVALGAGPSVEEVVRRADGWDGLVALRGDWAERTAIVTSHPLLVADPAEDPIALFDTQPAVTGDAGLVGGGWFAALAFDGPGRVAFHDHLIRLVDGSWQFEALWSDERAAVLTERITAWTALLAGDPADGPPAVVGSMTGPDPAEHLAAVEQAVELIRAGELYQVNVCTRLTGSFRGRPARLFADAAAALRPSRGAYVAGERSAVVSLSPELFLVRRGREIMTAPIKGTLPRDAEGNDERLRNSAKDTAENVMIVDLMRNDFGRVSEPGSVHAPLLLGVEAHPGLWHLVSRVDGRVRPEVGDAELLRATFPPGSVTGAPKVRAVAAIEALEPRPRGVYTGAIGFVSPLWGAEFNVAIRTFEIAADRIELGVGGGITADSVPMLEWRECLHKAAPLLRAAGVEPPPAPVRPPTRTQLAGGLLETLLAIDGRVLDAADHLARLDRSCREVFDAGLPAGLAAQVDAAARDLPGRAVVRVVVGPDRRATVAAAPARPPASAAPAVVVPRSDVLWRHKWADRAELVAIERGVRPAVPLFVAADGTVLETARGNVFLIEDDGTLVTAPLRDDVLPGITRRLLLDLARDEGRPTALRPFDRAELLRHPAFWTSTLSGAVSITRLDGTPLPRADDLIAGLARRLLGGTTGSR